MPSIRRGENGLWFVRWRALDGRQPSYQPPSGTKAAAERAKREIERCLDRGEDWIRPSRRAERERAQTLEAALKAYLDAKAITFRSKQSLKNLDNVLGSFLRFLDERDGDRWAHRPAALSRGALRGFYRWLLEKERPVSALTANNYVRAMQRAWEWLYDDEEWGDIVPRARKIELPRERPKRTGRAPTWAQMDATILAAREAGEWCWRLFFVCRCTGLRPWRQAFNLLWEHVDLEAGMLTIPGEMGKTWAERAGRRVPMAPVLIEEIATWGTRRGYLIDCPGEKRTPDQQRLKQWWAAAGLEPEHLPWRHVHGFRHGFVTGMAELGVDKMLRCALTGHANGDTHTATYTDFTLLEAKLREAVAKVPPITPMPARFGELDRRRRQRAHQPDAQVVAPDPGGAVDWDAQPLGQVPDTHIARGLSAALGRKVSPGVIYYQRTIRGIPACNAPTGKVVWAEVPWARWQHLTNRQVADRLGVSPSAVSRRRVLAGWGRG